MSLFFKLDLIGENVVVHVYKKMFSSKIDSKEFNEYSKRIPFSAFLKKCGPDLKKKIEKDMAAYKEVRVLQREKERLEREKSSKIKEMKFGPYVTVDRLLQDVDCDTFIFGDGTSFSMKEKEKIIEYGVSKFGESFKEDVEKNDLLNYNKYNRHGGDYPGYDSKWHSCVTSNVELKRKNFEAGKKIEEDIAEIDVKIEKIKSGYMVCDKGILNFQTLNKNNSGRK